MQYNVSISYFWLLQSNNITLGVLMLFTLHLCKTINTMVIFQPCYCGLVFLPREIFHHRINPTPHREKPKLNGVPAKRER